MRLMPRFLLVLIVAWLATPAAAAENNTNAAIRAFV